MARAWATLGDNKQAMSIIKPMWLNSAQYMLYYCSLDGARFHSSENDAVMHFYILQQLLNLAQNVDKSWADARMIELGTLMKLFENKGGNLGY